MSNDVTIFYFKQSSTWTTVDTQTDLTLINHTVTIQLPLNTTSYSSYILVVTKNIPSGGTNGANIDSFNLFTELAVPVTS